MKKKEKEKEEGGQKKKKREIKSYKDLYYGTIVDLLEFFMVDLSSHEKKYEGIQQYYGYFPQRVGRSKIFLLFQNFDIQNDYHIMNYLPRNTKFIDNWEMAMGEFEPYYFKKRGRFTKLKNLHIAFFHSEPIIEAKKIEKNLQLLKLRYLNIKRATKLLSEGNFIDLKSLELRSHVEDYPTIGEGLSFGKFKNLRTLKFINYGKMSIDTINSFETYPEQLTDLTIQAVTHEFHFDELPNLKYLRLTSDLKLSNNQLYQLEIHKKLIYLSVGLNDTINVYPEFNYDILNLFLRSESLEDLSIGDVMKFFEPNLNFKLESNLKFNKEKSLHISGVDFESKKIFNIFKQLTNLINLYIYVEVELYKPTPVKFEIKKLYFGEITGTEMTKPYLMSSIIWHPEKNIKRYLDFLSEVKEVVVTIVYLDEVLHYINLSGTSIDDRKRYTNLFRNDYKDLLQELNEFISRTNIEYTEKSVDTSSPLYKWLSPSYLE